MILREGIVLAFVGLGLGLVGAVFVGRAIRSTLYGVGTVDFTAFTAVSIMLLASALLACYVPPQRAAKGDPMAALGAEPGNDGWTSPRTSQRASASLPQPQSYH